MHRYTLRVAAGLMAVAAGPALSDEGSGSRFVVSGFGTIAVVHNSTDQADYAPNPTFQPNGVGRSRDIGIAGDTKGGLQVDFHATSQLSATAQFLTKQSVTDSFEPTMEWAYLKYSPLPDFSVRIGRIRPAIYLLSDYEDVNYANPWVRPPMEVYSAVSIGHMQGVDLLWKPKLGSVTMLVQPFYGNDVARLISGSAAEKNIAGVNASASYESFMFRAGYMKEDSTINVPSYAGLAPLFQALCGFDDPTACAYLANFPPNAQKYTYKSIGGTYDDGTNFAYAEGGKRTDNTHVSDATSWYISGGRRFGKFTPYLTYAKYTNDSATLSTSGTFPGGFGLPSTNSVITALAIGGAMDQHTVSLGLRYDLITNVALKAQWDLINTSPKDGQPGTGTGLFNNATAAFADRSNHVSVATLSLDFVF